MARHFGPLGVAVGTEPGEFLVKESAVHLAEVVTVEDREGMTFVGLDTGWNAMNEHFVYRIPFFPILCRAADAPPVHDVTFIGPHQRGARSVRGGSSRSPRCARATSWRCPTSARYNASMTSFHCMREPPRRCSFEDRA